MTRAELSELGLENLIGTEALRAYMHGYFMDNKLYQRAKMVAKPSMYEEYQKEKNRQKAKERKERRITLNRKKPEVNAELAAKLEESGGLADGRFSALFQNPDFEIDKNSEEFKRTHASGLGKRVESEEEGSAGSDGGAGGRGRRSDFSKDLTSIQALSGAAIQPLDWKTAEKKEACTPCRSSDRPYLCGDEELYRPVIWRGCRSGDRGASEESRDPQNRASG